MISIKVLVTQISGLRRQDLERWIANHWVRLDDQPAIISLGRSTPRGCV